MPGADHGTWVGFTTGTNGATLRKAVFVAALLALHPGHLPAETPIPGGELYDLECLLPVSDGVIGDQGI